MAREGSARVSAAAVTWFVAGTVLAGCDPVNLVDPGSGPAPPQGFDAFYYGGAVHLSWELASGWNGEPFRVWGRRVSDSDYFLVAEVTSCADRLCSYADNNVVEDVTYVYYVAAVDLAGFEAASSEAIQVYVPVPIAPPAPTALDAIPLDEAIYLTWSDTSRQDDDFAFYRVYLEGSDGSVVLLGETDSEGFLDELVENGSTYGYFVAAVDDQGHESDGSALIEGTPRPDFHGELLFAFEDVADESGFRFQPSEGSIPVLPGDDPSRDFRLEADADGWWLVPGPGVQVATEPVFTTSLRCGPAADVGCVDIRFAPDAGYSPAQVSLVPEFSYVIRVPVGGGSWQYGVVRVTHVGFAQEGAIAIFDWAFQLQPDNPSLLPAPG